MIIHHLKNAGFQKMRKNCSNATIKNVSGTLYYLTTHSTYDHVPRNVRSYGRRGTSRGVRLQQLLLLLQHRQRLQLRNTALREQLCHPAGAATMMLYPGINYLGNHKFERRERFSLHLCPQQLKTVRKQI